MSQRITIDNLHTFAHFEAQMLIYTLMQFFFTLPLIADHCLRSSSVIVIGFIVHPSCVINYKSADSC